MQSCSTAGSIVVVNITDLRGDAVIVTANAFKVLPLPGLSAGQAKDWIGQDLTTTSLNDRGRKNKVYLQFLSWLWLECVRPVLDKLQCYVQPSADDLPRVWWMGTGLASTLLSRFILLATSLLGYRKVHVIGPFHPTHQQSKPCNTAKGALVQLLEFYLVAILGE